MKQIYNRLCRRCYAAKYPGRIGISARTVTISRQDMRPDWLRNQLCNYHLRRVAAVDGFTQFWNIYQDAFPQEERRDIKDYRENLIRNPHYKFAPYFKEGSMIGFVSFWDLDAFLFIEHFAIHRKARGNGYGTRILRKLMNKARIVLEVEPPVDTITQRRVRFYRRMGFHLNDYKYVQPPYRQGEHSVPLKLMSYPAPIGTDKVEAVTKRIYHHVYRMKLGYK